jgi:hypothetical protein
MFLMFLLVFFEGFQQKAGFGCGVLVVSLWWVAGERVVFRRAFARVERCAIFLDLFFAKDCPAGRAHCAWGGHFVTCVPVLVG